MITKYLALYLRDVRQIKNIVGDHIYAGRIPKSRSPKFALLLRTIAMQPDYNLASEFGAAQPTVQIEGLSSQPGADQKIVELMDYCRLAMNTYTAGPAWMGTDATRVWVTGCQVARGAMSTPVPDVDASNQWIYRRSLDVTITHHQDVVLPTLN